MPRLHRRRLQALQNAESSWANILECHQPQLESSMSLAPRKMLAPEKGSHFSSTRGQEVVRVDSSWTQTEGLGTAQWAGEGQTRQQGRASAGGRSHNLTGPGLCLHSEWGGQGAIPALDTRQQGRAICFCGRHGVPQRAVKCAHLSRQLVHQPCHWLAQSHSDCQTAPTPHRKGWVAAHRDQAKRPGGE